MFSKKPDPKPVPNTMGPSAVGRRTLPSRSLLDRLNPMVYVKHESTDIRTTFETARRQHAGD